MFNFKLDRAEYIYLYLLKDWLISVFALARKNTYTVSFTASFAVLGVEGLQVFLRQEILGTTNLVIIIVLGTVLMNTYWGIQKSKYIREYYIKLLKVKGLDPTTHDLYLAKIQTYMFQPRRLKFVSFKFFALLFYLFFIQNLLHDGGTLFDYGAEVLCKVPLAIFWYYEYKSIGENSAVVYDRKASIFTIVEDIFEFKVLSFLGKSKKEEEKNKPFKRNSVIENLDKEE